MIYIFAVDTLFPNIHFKLAEFAIQNLNSSNNIGCLLDTKVVELDAVYNFVVEFFFIWDSSDAQIVTLSYKILNYFSNFVVGAQYFRESK